MKMRRLCGGLVKGHRACFHASMPPTFNFLRPEAIPLPYEKAPSPVNGAQTLARNFLTSGLSCGFEVKEKFRQPITKKAAGGNIRRIMEPQVDPAPSDETSSEVEEETPAGKAAGEEGGHHESIERMSARKARIEDFAWSFCESKNQLLRERGTLAADEKLEAVDDGRLDSIEENELSRGASGPGPQEREQDEREDRKMATKMGEPGEHPIEKGGGPKGIGCLDPHLFPGHSCPLSQGSLASVQGRMFS